MAKKHKTKAPGNRWFWRLKLVLAILALVLGFTLVPRRFIPAGRARDVHEALGEARDHAVGLAKETAEKAVDRVAEEAPDSTTTTASGTDTITICSFNVQFLGSSKSRDDEALASVVKGYDIVVVQELVAPPYAMNFPDGTPVKPDPQAAEFFEAMKANGFTYWVSEEDTGTGKRIHNNGFATEWWVTFYRDSKVSRALDLPHGFLAEDRSNHDDYERVPYAFSFRAGEGGADFVLVAVHLQPGDGRKDAARRKHELGSIAAWIDANDETEGDFVVLGDCNIEDAEELADATPAGFLSLNDECRPTNTNVRGPKPYDHVLFQPAFTGEIERDFDMVVIDLIEAMQPLWRQEGAYPGRPYNHNGFRKWYSDHHPVVFRMRVAADDD